MSSHLADIEGDWQIVHYTKHPECMNYKIIIKGHGLDPNVFKIHINIVNELTCILQHNAETNQSEVSDMFSTQILGPTEDLHTEHILRELITSIENAEVHDEHQLVFLTKNDERIQLERLS